MIKIVCAPFHSWEEIYSTSASFLSSYGQAGWDGSLDGTYRVSRDFSSRFNLNSAPGAQALVNAIVEAGPNAEYLYRMTGGADPQNSNGSGPDYIEDTSDSCVIRVEFKGSNWLHKNGPRTGGRGITGEVYGLGFTVSGYAYDGAIGVVEEGQFPFGLSKTPKVVNPNGTWTLQQFTAFSDKATYGSHIVPGSHSTFPDGPHESSRQIDGGTFVWSDFPGQAKHGYTGWPDLTAYEGDWDFAVKAISGNQQCEVKFHARMTLQNGNWEVNWWRKP